MAERKSFKCRCVPTPRADVCVGVSGEKTRHTHPERERKIKSFQMKNYDSKPFCVVVLFPPPPTKQSETKIIFPTLSKMATNVPGRDTQSLKSFFIL